MTKWNQRRANSASARSVEPDRRAAHPSDSGLTAEVDVVPKRPLGSWMTAYLTGIFVVFAFFQVSGLDEQFPSAIGRAPYYGLYFGAIALVVARVVTVKEHRLAWGVLAVGFTIYNLASVYYSAVLAKLDTVPLPSLADAGWIALYPFAYVSILLLIHTQTGKITATTWIDGAISALGSSAALSALVMGLLIKSNAAETLGLVTILAYPTGDVLLLGLAVGSILFIGIRPTQSWFMLTVGLAFFAVTDIVYVTMQSYGTFETGSVLDLGWGAGVAFIGISAWQQDRVLEPIDRRRAMLTIALPMFFAVTSLAVLSVAVFADIPVASFLLAVATLALVVARIALSFRDALDLGKAQGQARTDDLTGLRNRRALYEYLSLAIEERDPRNRDSGAVAGPRPVQRSQRFLRTSGRRPNPRKDRASHAGCASPRRLPCPTRRRRVRRCSAQRSRTGSGGCSTIEG